jgi:hypothetical protein
MKLHTVFVSYNRLELTKRAISSYFDTVTVSHTVSVVDNGSDMAAALLLIDGDFTTHLLAENHYPGYATNYGWSDAPEDATHLHRADNDHIFLPGWCEEVQRMFEWQPRLGQLGLRTDEQEGYAKRNVGGNCIIPRALWDEGMRWDERPWPQLRDEVGAGHTEDSLFTPEVVRRKWQWDRVERLCIQPISVESTEDPYYRKTWAERGIVK